MKDSKLASSLRFSNPTRFRSLMFGASLFLAGALASWHIRSVGQETGLLRFGGRQLREISRANDPENSNFWSNVFAAFTFGFICAAVITGWLAWEFGKKKT